jgi:hypothetical protein
MDTSIQCLSSTKALVQHSSTTSGSSFLKDRHLLVARSSSWQPFTKKPHLSAKLSVISQPFTSQGSDQTSKPVFSLADLSYPSYKPPNKSQPSSWVSNVPMFLIALSRIVGHGSKSIQGSWGAVFCSSVGASDTGTPEGGGKSGIFVRHVSQSRVVRRWTERT